MEGSVIAARLRFARERKGFSQKKLGLLIGLPPSLASPRINRYERESRQPHFSTILRISKVLQISSSYFYEPDDVIAEVILHLSVLPRHKLEDLLKKLCADSLPENS